MNRPWMKFHTRDWLDNKELRRCSPTSRAVLVDLMCLAAEGSVYGYLCDKVGPLDHAFMAARCFVSLTEFQSSIDELLRCERLHRDANGLFISRMVRDEEIRCARAAGGKLSIGHPHTHPKGTLPFESEGTHVLKTTSRERTSADSDSVCVSDSSSDSKKQTQEEAKSGDYPTLDARWTPAGRPPGSQNDISGAEIDISGAGMPISGAHRRAADLSGSESSRWEEFWQAYPRKQRKDAACQQFLSVVTVASEGRVFRCLERYLSSDEVGRGVVANPDKWLYEQHRNEWEGDWPKRPELQAAVAKKHVKIDESKIVPYDPFELRKRESA